MVGKKCDNVSSDIIVGGKYYILQRNKSYNMEVQSNGKEGKISIGNGK